MGKEYADPAEQHRPEEVRVALHALSHVVDQPVPSDEVVDVPEGDKGIVHQVVQGDAVRQINHQDPCHRGKVQVTTDGRRPAIQLAWNWYLSSNSPSTKRAPRRWFKSRANTMRTPASETDWSKFKIGIFATALNGDHEFATST
jgi:hypothetical protein